MEKFKVKFKVSKNDSFYTQLKERVDNYFAKRNNNDKANAAMIFKMAVITFLFLGSYILIISNRCSEIQLLLLALIFGFSNALVAFNISHDASHNALFKSKKWNHLFSYSFNLIGVNRYIWNIKHNISHHTFTNIPGYDMDIEEVKIARLVNHVPLEWYHRFQHIYVPLLYPFTSLFMLLFKDFQMFGVRHYGNHTYVIHPHREYIILIASKIIYLLYAVIIPFVLINIVWWKFLLGFLLMHFVLGVFLAIILFPVHALDDSTFPEPDENGNMDNSWVRHQVETTTNFGANSRLLNWLCGGLNTHIVHHIFPNICHIHYYELTKIIRQTASEHDIKFRENSLREAIASHLRFLKHTGTNWF